MKRGMFGAWISPCLFCIAAANVPAQSISNGAFNNGLTGWNASQCGGAAAPGSVSVVVAQALLLEGDSAIVSLSQQFSIPVQPQTLSFNFYVIPGFDQTNAFFPDAFEVSLLKVDNTSAVPRWKPEATSFFNVQQNGVVNLAQGVTFSGDLVTLNVSGIASGTHVTLFFDLLGADHDLTSGVTIDNVTLVGGDVGGGGGWPG